MKKEVRLIEELRRLADLTPPICSKDKASEIEVFGRSVTVYCKPFEQFQDTLRQAADRIEELESLRPKGRWFEMIETKEDGYTGEYYEDVYYNCINCDYASDWNSPYCPNCGAKMTTGE